MLTQMLAISRLSLRASNNILKQSIRNSRRIPRYIWPEPVGITPCLDQILRETNYFRKASTFIDIGLKLTSSHVKEDSLKGVTKLSVTEDASQVDIDTLLGEIDEKSRPRTGEEDDKARVDDVQSHWECSEEGINNIVTIAHHSFGLFRDLFPQGDPNLQRPFALTKAIADNQTRYTPYYIPTNMPANAVNETGLSVPPVHYFKPIVPMKVEFLSPDSEDDQYLIVTPAIRGNLVHGEFGSEPPQITINAFRLNSALISSDSTTLSGESERVTLLNDDNSGRMYSLFMVNLDSHIESEDRPIVHWAALNISSDMKNYSEPYSYLPVYGIRGLGYSRYAIVLFTHPTSISLDRVDNFELAKREIDFNKLREDHSFTPVGLNWFQTVWGDTCNAVFHKYLNMKAPVYDYIQEEEKFAKQTHTPVCQPFNIFLDYYRDPKELANEVLKERLKNIDIHNYHKEFDPPRVPPNIQPIPEDVPSWKHATIFKQRMRVGRWRGLRPASALRPLNNNADLDKPILKYTSNIRSPLNFYNHYPISRRQPKPLRGSFWQKAPHENLDIRVADTQGLTDDEKKQLDLGKFY